MCSLKAASDTVSGPAFCEHRREGKEGGAEALSRLPRKLRLQRHARRLQENARDHSVHEALRDCSRRRALCGTSVRVAGKAFPDLRARQVLPPLISIIMDGICRVIFFPSEDTMAIQGVPHAIPALNTRNSLLVASAPPALCCLQNIAHCDARANCLM